MCAEESDAQEQIPHSTTTESAALDNSPTLTESPFLPLESGII